MEKYMIPLLTICCALIIIIVIVLLLRKIFFTKELIGNETLVNKLEDDNDDDIEKINLNVWKKIFKIIVKDKKSIVVMIIAVINLAINDIVYPLLNKYALEHFFNDNL